MENRLTELETKVAYQDQTIEELNPVVIELRKELEEVEKKLKNLVDQIGDEGIKDASLEVPPPHY